MADYIPSFLIGGSTVAGIKFLSNRVPPKFTAILGALPIGLISSLYMTKVNVLEHYLQNYAAITLILVLTALLYDILLLNGNSIILSFSISMLFLLTLNVLKLFYVKNL